MTVAPARVARPAVDRAKRARRRALSVLGGALGLAGIVWVVRGLDYDRLATILATADPGFLLLVPLAIAIEQLIRAWKWGRLLDGLRGIGTLRLFGATMAGYLVNLLTPFGVSPLVRSWLVARLEGLTMSALLATVAIDRLLDGIVFVGLVVLVLVFAAFPDPNGEIRLGLALAGMGSLVVIVFLGFALRHHKRQIARGAGWILHLTDRLPARFAGRSQALLRSFSDGVVWPRERWRRVAVIVASAVVKLIAATHFLWAGLAFGIVLRPFDYLFLIVFLGFLIILTHVARIPGGFFVGAVFAVDLLGVGAEQALAMVTVVIASNVSIIGVVGVFTLWRNGIALADLRTGNTTDSDGGACRDPQAAVSE